MSVYDEILKSELQQVNQALNEYFDKRIETAKELGPIHQRYYINIREYMMRGGKRLRPLLVAVGYKCIRESVDVKYLYRVTSALEMLHNGSLLHDDLIDHDETRRGGPTIHALYREWFKREMAKDEERARDFGAAMAIVSGDSLLNMGAQMISDSELRPEIATACFRYYQSAYQELIEGVLLEMMMIQDPTVTLETYLKMIHMKTAVLFEKALLMGATIAGGSQSQLTVLAEFGVKVGQAFQIQDDILGSFGDEKVTGKAADGDIREGKKTILVIEAYQRSNQAQRETLDRYLGDPNTTPQGVDRVRQVFRESGALEAAQHLMIRLLDEGQKALDRAQPALIPKYKQFLIELSEFLVKRNY